MRAQANPLFCALEWIRTIDTRFRRAVLYPLSYEGRPAAEDPPSLSILAGEGGRHLTGVQHLAARHNIGQELADLA